MNESSAHVPHLAPVELDPVIATQRYLSLFERLSLLIGGGNIGEISERACELIAELLEVADCSLTILNGDGSALDLLAATHIPRSEWSKIHIQIADSVFEPILLRHQSMLVRTRAEFEKTFGRKSDPRYASASCVIVPLVMQDRIAGAINVAHPLTRESFERRDVTLLESVARLVGSALHSAHEYQEAMHLQKKLTDLFNSLSVGIIVVDGDGRITQGNHTAQDLFGFSAKGRPRLEEALHGTLYNVCCRLIRKVEAQGGVPEDSIDFKHGDQSIMLKVRVMRCLEEMIGEHLIMIEEAGQEEEVRRLRESENAKHSFLAIISHELRTPLTVIRAALPMLAPNGKPTPAETLAQVHKLLANNCHRLSEVVNSIIYVTEIESGTLELALRPTDVHRLLDEILERAASNAQQRRVTIVRRFEAEQPEVASDGQRLGTVFSELVNNALKFSNPNTEVILETHLREPWFEVLVTNVGHRIDPCQREGLFKKFYQGNQTLTRTVGGCGLGLFLVYNIVRLHGGNVELLDTEANETTFRVRLPLTQPGAAPGQPAT